MPYTLQLVKPIQTTKGEISSITFRDPSADDFFSLEPPARTIMQGQGTDPVTGKDREPKIEVIRDPSAFKKWCAALADTGMENLMGLSGLELARVYGWLSEQLNPSDEAASKN